MKNLFQVPLLSNRVSLGLLILRLIAGIAMAQHGWGKIQSPMNWMGPESTIPGFLQFLAALSEFGGGIAWALGALTPLASFGIACTMAFAFYFHAGIQGDPWVGQGATFELALSYLSIAICLILTGPGEYSVDRKVFGSKPTV